jgi:SAM-dependent methyltransferase
VKCENCISSNTAINLGVTEDAFMTGLKSNAEWKQWGKDDPVWGVASWASKRKNGVSPWTEEEFYALGQSDWRDFLGHWRQYESAQNCLEIGCGAGRITKQLAMSFDHVYAVDVSEDMISRAQKVVESGNVEFSVVDGLAKQIAELTRGITTAVPCYGGRKLQLV